MSKNSFDLRNMPRGADGTLLPALDGGNDTSRYQNGNDTSHKKLPSPRDYNREIYLFAASQSGGVTRGEIAKHLGLKKTPWLIEKIDALVSDGFLTRTNGTFRNGFLVYRYEVNQ